MNPPTRIHVIGSGPNGLSAAVRLAGAGMAVTLHEQAAEIGGGLRSDRDTLEGYVIDHCASVFPLAVASPFLSTLPLERLGVRWLHPGIALAHPFADGTAVLLHRSIDLTAAGLGRDGAAWRALFSPLAPSAADLMAAILGPVRPMRAPVAIARFGALGVLSADRLSRTFFRGEPGRSLFCGLAAHSFLRIDQPMSAAIGLVLGLLAHSVGWPVVEGGAGNLAAALGALLIERGGDIASNSRITDASRFPADSMLVLDTDPMQAASICGTRLPRRFTRRLRGARLGPAAFKVDYVLDGPAPWRAPECEEAGTLHLGGDWREIARSEADVVAGRCPERPFLIAGQPSRVDSGRTPAGRELFWAYCHVPRGANFDMTDRIETQIERFAPGFRDRVLHRIVTRPADFEAFNPSFPGGATGGLLPGISTVFAGALPHRSPHATPDPGIFLCSAYTPPGGGVHGMAGFHAAEALLRNAR